MLRPFINAAGASLLWHLFTQCCQTMTHNHLQHHTTTPHNLTLTLSAKQLPYVNVSFPSCKTQHTHSFAIQVFVKCLLLLLLFASLQNLVSSPGVQLRHVPLCRFVPAPRMHPPSFRSARTAKRRGALCAYKRRTPCGNSSFRRIRLQLASLSIRVLNVLAAETACVLLLSFAHRQHSRLKRVTALSRCITLQDSSPQHVWGEGAAISNVR